MLSLSNKGLKHHGVMRAGQELRPEPASLRWQLPAIEKNKDHEDDGMRARTSVCEIQLRQALGKSELADVRIEVGGVWVASAHRGVLSARSPVFARMLANETEEKNSGIIKLDDVSVEGLRAFLEFVYLGTAAHMPFR